MKEIEKEIRKICTNFSEDLGEVGTMSYALTEEQFKRLFDYLEKNFVVKGEVRDILLEDFLKYIEPWLEKPFRNPEFREKIIKQLESLE